MTLRRFLALLSLPSVVLTAQPASSDTVVDRAAAVAPLTLREAVDLALLRNLGIGVERMEAAVVAETVEIAEAPFDPVLSARSEWQRRLAPGVDGYTTNRAIGDNWTNAVSVEKKFSSGGTVSFGGTLDTGWLSPSGSNLDPDNTSGVSISARQPLLSGAGREVNLAPIVQARQNLTRSRLNLRKEVLDLLRDTEEAYWTLAAGHALLALRESSLGSARHLLEEAKARRERGVATRQDQLQAEAEVASQEVALVNARHSIAEAEDRLRLLLSGLEAPELETLRVVPLPESVPPAPEQFFRWVTRVRSFDVEAQIRAIEIEQADLDVRVADNADQPGLDLVAGAGVLGRDRTVDDAYAGMFNRSGYDLNAGLQLTLPIGFRESEARLRQAERRREQARLRMATTQQQTMYEARASYRLLNTSRDRLLATRATVALQRQAYEGEVARYNAGDASMSDVLQAKAALDLARLNNLQSLLDCMLASARVARWDGEILPRLGFSWETVDANAGIMPAGKRE